MGKFVHGHYICDCCGYPIEGKAVVWNGNDYCPECVEEAKRDARNEMEDEYEYLRD